MLYGTKRENHLDDTSCVIEDINCLPSNMKGGYKMRRILGLVFLAGANIATGARAENCPIADFKQYISYSRNAYTNIAYINAVSSRTTETKASAASVSFLDIVGLNQADARSAASALQKILDIKMTQRDETALLISQLDDSGRAAYIECIKRNKDPLTVTLSEAAGDKKRFFVEVHWHPFYAAPDPSPVTLRVLNGKVQKDHPRTVRPQDHVVFAVEREEIFEPIELSVAVDGKAAPMISLPGLPTKYWAHEKRAVEEHHEVYGGRDEINKTLCITLKNDERDAFIVPKTMTFLPSPEIVNMGSISEYPPPNFRRHEDTREVCSLIRWGLSSKDGRVKGTGKLSASIIKAYPVQGVQGKR